MSSASFISAPLTRLWIGAAAIALLAGPAGVGLASLNSAPAEKAAPGDAGRQVLY